MHCRVGQRVPLIPPRAKGNWLTGVLPKWHHSLAEQAPVDLHVAVRGELWMVAHELLDYPHQVLDKPNATSGSGVIMPRTYANGSPCGLGSSHLLGRELARQLGLRKPDIRGLQRGQEALRRLIISGVRNDIIVGVEPKVPPSHFRIEDPVLKLLYKQKNASAMH